ncbi:MAG: transglycosylase domain-containing protein [Geothrix sp.]|uniref:Transglycosylase domain-containing protein n=1 Tax=Candidatus Geothrix odensensis TaxID=2954440 RepID=A0A936K6I6_9BACT|nr:transglycosylase domain-containing protein [Candidatus Geothrix odensensis]MCC6513833.1 transglycosylase domain-containing protein [Geothrix sp.]
MPFTPSPQQPHPQPDRRWWRLPVGTWSLEQRRWFALGVVLGLALVQYLGTLLMLRSAPVRRALRTRAVAALATRLPGARLEGGVSVDAAFRPVMGPVVLPSADDGAPLVVVDRIMIQPRLWRLLTGHLEPALVALSGVHIQGGPEGRRLPELARALRPERDQGTREALNPAASAPPVLAFTGLDLRLEEASSRRPPLVVGPLGGRLRLDRMGRRTQALLTTEGPGQLVGTVEATWGDGPGALRMHLHGLGAEALPEGLRRGLPFEIRSGALDLTLEAPRLDTFSRGEGQFKLATRNLTLFAVRLDPEPLGPPPVRVSGRVRWDARARTADLDEATVALDAAGRVALQAALSIALHPEPRFNLALRVDALDWTALTATLPPKLAPPPGAPGIVGQLAGGLRVTGPLRDPVEWQVEGSMDLSRLAPASQDSVAKLTRSFVHQAQVAGGGLRRVIVGPENPAFVPLAELPDHFVRAVLESEDAGFYGHPGFDLSAVQEALASGGRLRGASTLTQQLAKNLFLSRERTLSRKVREALATVALEVAVGKRRILEIYLNLVEWGDGVNGIGEAARHWFGKDARALSPKEAVMLATVIPNPVRYEMYRRKGALTPAWVARVADLLGKLHTIGVLDDEALRAAEAENLTFAGGLPAGNGPLEPAEEPMD